MATTEENSNYNVSVHCMNLIGRNYRDSSHATYIDNCIRTKTTVYCIMLFRWAQIQCDHYWKIILTQTNKTLQVLLHSILQLEWNRIFNLVTSCVAMKKVWPSRRIAYWVSCINEVNECINLSYMCWTTNIIHPCIESKSVGATEAMLLLQHGADVNAETTSRNTALHIASSRNKCDIASLCITAGADLHKTNVRTYYWLVNVVGYVWGCIV